VEKGGESATGVRGQSVHPVTNYAEKCAKRMPRLEEDGGGCRYSGASFNARTHGRKEAKGSDGGVEGRLV